MRCEEVFRSIYRRDPDDVSFCPYRVCPIGAHSDHNFGKVTGFAIDRGLRIAYSAKKNGVVETSSLQFEKRAQWHIDMTPAVKDGDWADYLRGATLALKRRFNFGYGVCGVIEGELPIGGLSSSAAVTISFILALCRANGLTLSARELIEVALEAERGYVGVSVGKLDQSCEIFSRKGRLLYLDTLTDEYELISLPSSSPDYRIAVFFSGLEHSLVGSKFNKRVDELRAGAYALQAYMGAEYGKFEDAAARYVPREVFDRYKSRLPDAWRRRCEHWYGEYERVERGADAWRRGDLEEFGRLSFESGWSSIHNWESGAPEQIRLYEIMRETPGVYGGRFAGAGFKGCCVALVDPGRWGEIESRVKSAYLRDFPHLSEKYSSCLCESADGAVI